MAFRFKRALPEMPKGAERALIEQFRDIQNDLDDIRGPAASTTAIISKDCLALVGQLLLVAPPAAGMNIGIPPATKANISRSLRIAVVGGVLSPGATVSIIGGKGTINGAVTLTLASRGMTEITSVGDSGWSAVAAGGGSGGGESLAATLAIGNTTGGTDLIITAGDELQVGGTAGVLGQVFTSGGPGASPSWVTSTAATLAQAKLIASMRA